MDSRFLHRRHAIVRVNNFVAAVPVGHDHDYHNRYRDDMEKEEEKG